jgi:intein/homing endonuclease
MIIAGRNGRRKSLPTKKEIVSRMDHIKVGLTPDEIALVRALGEDEFRGSSMVMDNIIDHIYHTTPVSMEQFLEDPYYLGESCTTIYPVVKKDLIDLFRRPYREVLFTGSLGYGKCVSADTEIYNPMTGLRSTIKELSLLYSDIGCCSYDKNLKQIVPAKANAKYSGVKKVGELILNSGKKITLSLDHPVLCPYGWVNASDLKIGDLVGTARSLPEPLNKLEISDDEVIWVAYMLADGGTTATSMTFTNSNLSINEEFECITKRIGNPSSRYNGCSFVAMDGKAKTVRPLAMGWLRDKYGLNKKSIHKRVPSEFYGLDNRQLALFLNRIWSCDGWICKSGKAWGIGICLGSEKFIIDIQNLLLRFGIHSRTRKKISKYTHKGEKKEKDSWCLQIFGKEEICKFVDNIGYVKGKEYRCIDLKNDTNNIVGNSNVDIVPISGDEERRLRKELGPISRGQYWFTTYNQMVGKKRFDVFSSMYDLPDWCNWWGSLFWDRVKSFDIKDEMQDVYDLEVPGFGNFIPYGIVIHNTFCSSIAICRIIYELSCMVSPQKTFGLSTGSEIVIPLVSKNLTLAREIIKTAVDTKIKESPYFMTLFTPKFATEYTLFPNNIRVIIASYGSDRVTGGNVFSSVLDETNFPPRRKAQQIAQGFGQKLRAEHFDIVEKVYQSLVRRIKSRFQRAGGGFPGMVVLASSAATVESFTERKIRKSAEDPDVFCRDHTAWTAKPKSEFCGEVFWVLCSTSSMNSRILTDDEVELVSDEYLEANDAFLMDIPVEYKEDFESNMEEALRDIAGFSTQAISLFVQRQSAVYECVDEARKHPFSCLEYTSGARGQWDWDTLCIQMERKLPGGFVEKAYRPRRNPEAFRWCHIDVGVSGDSCGFTIAHIERWVDVVRRGSDGGKHEDTAPYYVVDAMLRINPPPGQQIYFPDLRTMIYQFMEKGYKFIGFSSDTYMYVEMHQQLKRRGITPHIISMDTSTTPYDELKSAFYENRIEIYDYEPFAYEFLHLEYDRIVGKIDHPQAGCFVGETRIPLLDGTVPMISELDGKEVWVYSCNENGSVVPGRARGRCTKLVTELVDVILDSGAVVRCTPDHPWMMRDGSYKRISDVRPGIDRVMPIGRQWPINGGYEGIVDKDKCKKVTHHIVWEFFNGKRGEGNCIHHLNGNKLDNRPDNLSRDSMSDHARKHTLERHRSDPEYRKKVADGLQAFNLSKRGMAVHAEAFRRTTLARTKQDWDRIAEKRPAFRRDIDLSSLEKARDQINANGAARVLGCGRNVIIRILKNAGFGSWTDFLASEPGNNHKVRYIIPVHLDTPVPVYDLEVDVFSNFALSVGVFVHNSKDQSDSVAGAIFGLKESSKRMPLEGMSFGKDNVVPYEDSWVSGGLVPMDKVDMDAVKEARNSKSNDFLPIIFGD